jgi:hypothetical protein
MTTTDKGITPKLALRERTTGKIDAWAVDGPSDVGKQREAWRSNENVPPGQPRCIPRLPQAANCWADELACKPESVIAPVNLTPSAGPGDGIAGLGQPGQGAHRLVGLDGDGEVGQGGIGVAEG